MVFTFMFITTREHELLLVDGNWGPPEKRGDVVRESLVDTVVAEQLECLITDSSSDDVVEVLHIFVV